MACLLSIRLPSTFALILEGIYLFASIAMSANSPLRSD